MSDSRMTREELIAELVELRERLELLEATPSAAGERTSRIDEDLRIAHLLAEAAAVGSDTQAVARILAREIQTAFDARSTSLYIVSHDQTTLDMQTLGLKPGLATAAERMIGAKIPLPRIPRADKSLYWRALRLNETQIFRKSSEIEAVLREFAAASAASAPGAAPPPPESAGNMIKLLAFGCMVLVPLTARGRQLGLLVVSAHDQYSDADVARLTSLGPHVASILATTQTEEDWRRERDLATTYLSRAPGFLLLLDDQGCVQSISQDGCEILGLPERAIIGRNWAESFVPERFRQSAVQRISQILGGGPDEIFDGHALTARGDERDVRWRTTGLSDPGGRVTSLLATGVDLTRVKQSEQREDRARRRFRALIEHATAVLLIVDAEGFVTFASPSVTNILGYCASEVTGINCFELVHPDDAGPLIEQFRLSQDNAGLTPTYEMRIRHKDGSWKVLEGKASVQLDNPDIKGIILAGRDVTDRVRIEDSIEKSAARFCALLENSHELMLVLAPDLRIRYASPSVSRDLGYTRSTLSGLSFEEIAHGEDFDRSRFRPADHPGIPVGVKMRLRTDDRTWVWYDVSITELIDDPAVEGFIINASRTCDTP